MHRTLRRLIAKSPRSILAVVGVLAVLGFAVACSGGDGPSDEDVADQARLEELRSQRDALMQTREEIAALEERLEMVESGEMEAPAEGEGAEEGEEPAEPVDPVALQAEIDNLDADLTAQVEQFNADVVAFINDHAPVQGEPVPEIVNQAFALKASEDILLAKEYITQGGDYGRAIQIYQDILAFDPENAEAQEALAWAEEMRYMNEERFSQVETGMTMGQIEKIVGVVNYRNRREFPERGVVAWYYPKNAAGEAAAVYFRKKGDTFEVYKADFNAVTKEGEEEAGA